MKNVLLRMAAAATVAVSLSAAATNAAAQQFNWSGFYLGAQAGYATTDVSWTFVQQGFADQAYTHDISGFIGGGQFGYQQQFGQFLIGAELSLSGGPDLADKFASTLVANRSRQLELSWLMLATAKLGYTFDRALLYLKGGYASANIGIETSVTSTAAISGSSSDRNSGWTIGGGLDYALTPNWILGLEYNYVQLDGGNRAAVVSPGFAVASHRVDDIELHTVMARLNFLFGNGR